MANRKLCQFMAGCPIYTYFNYHKLQDCLYDYCIGNFENCQRYQLRISGQTVPRLMLPGGQFLEEAALEEAVSSSSGSGGDGSVRTAI